MQHDVPRSRLRLIAFVPGFVYVDDPDDVLPDIPEVPVPEQPVALIPQEPVPVEPEAVSQAMVEFRSSGDTMVEMERQMIDICDSSTVGPSSDSSLSPDTRAFVYCNDPTILEAILPTAQARRPLRKHLATGKAMSQAKARVRSQAKARASRAKYLANGKGKARASRAKAKPTPKSEPRKRCRYKKPA